MTMNCPFCQAEVTKIDQHDVKSGNWVQEPINIDADVACYDWDEERLIVYFH